MPQSYLRILFNCFSNKWRSKKTFCLLIFLGLITSACGTPKNVTFLNQLKFPAANYLVWSPNGDEIAITAIGGNPPISAIHILDVKSQKIRLLVNQDFSLLNAETWVPDGTQLAFFGYSSKDSKQGTWLADINGAKPPKFFDSDLVLAWSPNNKIVIARKDISKQEVTLYIRDYITNDETNIFSETGVGVFSGSLSSDGSKLVFVFEKDSRKNSIYFFDQNTKKAIQVIPDEDVGNPSLSPDGGMIAYTKGFGANYLHIMKSDGSCDVEILNHLDVRSPVWSPNGKQIAYIAPQDGGVYLLDLVGVFGKDIVEKGLPCTK